MSHPGFRANHERQVLVYLLILVEVIAAPIFHSRGSSWLGSMGLAAMLTVAIVIAILVLIVMLALVFRVINRG